MPLFGSIKGSIISEPFLLLHDLGQLKKGNMVDVALYDDHLELSTMFVKPPIKLPYSKITDVYYGGEKEIVQKNKSVIGRAAVGGLVLGSVGAIVGATSGTGKKEKTVTKMKFIISYNSNGKTGLLQFDDPRVLKGRKLANTLKHLCGIEDEIITSL